MRFPILLAGLLLAQPVRAADPAKPFLRMSPHELCVQFSLGTATHPVGKLRGRVLWVDDAKLPRFRGLTQSLLWRGKEFDCDGTFTNRFLGFTALPSRGFLAESWADGGAAFVMEYPPGTPLFGRYRDELREVAPGVWLGRAWDRATGRPLGWFLLSKK
jgi:hypothetical protein